MKRAFISRDFDETPLLKNFLQSQGFVADARSLIRREYIPFDSPEISPEQWLFFSSPYAVKAWFEQGGKPAKLAAIGEGTSKILAQYGNVEFCGKSSDTKETAKAFLNIVQHFPVIFPSAEKGLKQVQQTMQPGQYIDIICYRTLPQPQIIEEAELYIFSSPSNVHSFFSMNRLPETARVVSYGPSSTRAILEYQQCNVIESQGTGLSELINAISSALLR